MANFKRVKEGDPITADDYNAIAERLERFANLSVAGGYLQLWSGPDGHHLALHQPMETLALLSGSTSPYSFVEVDEDASGAFVTRGVGDSGTAYEVNNVPALDGKVVSLVWTEAGDWRFQWVGVTPTVCVGTSRICLTITSDGCTNTPAYGATVDVVDGNGTSVGTCTSAGTITSLTLGSAGSGYTNGTGYSLGFTGGGGTGATGTFDVVGGGVTNVALTNPGSGYTSAPTVSFPGAGSGTGAAVTANMGAKCCIDIPHSGNYTITTTMPGATPITTTVQATCNTDTTVSVAFPASTLGTACIHFDHCGYANGGDTIVISKAGTPVATVTTNGSGNACLRLGAGSYTYVLTTPNGNTTLIGSPFTVSACSTVNAIAGVAITKVCVSAWLPGANSCTGTITIKDGTAGATLGTGTLSTVFDGFLYFGVGCATISEVLRGSFTVFISYPSYGTLNGGTVPVACYTESGPFFFDLHELGPPC